MRSVAFHFAVLAYCLSCATLHQVLTIHYTGQCCSWLSFAETGYCSIVRKTLGALRASPLFVAGAVLANPPIALEYAAGRQNRAVHE